MKAIVYGAPWCRACKQAVKWLKARGVKVEEKDYTEAPIQVWSLPVIVIGDEILTGFDQRKLRQALRRAKP